MSQRQIERALRAKGIEWETVEYGAFICPGEYVDGWQVSLTEDCEEEIAGLVPGFDDFDPDCRNTTEVLEWIESLPDLSAHAPSKPHEATQ